MCGERALRVEEAKRSAQLSLDLRKTCFLPYAERVSGGDHAAGGAFLGFPLTRRTRGVTVHRRRDAGLTSLFTCSLRRWSSKSVLPGRYVQGSGEEGPAPEKAD